MILIRKTEHLNFLLLVISNLHFSLAFHRTG
jgi:hypothetical protein